MASTFDRPLSMKLTQAGVSRREAEVLDRLGEGLTNAEIAARLHISARTVEGHVSSLLRKLSVHDRVGLAHLAQEVGGTRPSSASRLSPLTPLIGRVAERTALAAALERERLVTAVGPGGIGKTRLAAAVAEDLIHTYPDGVWYLDLVPVTSPARLTAALAEVLRLGEPGARSTEEAVLTALSAREALLVLDNCEHLTDAVARLVEVVLTHCPLVKVLTTSRTRMRVPFERVFPVPCLSLWDDDPATLESDTEANGQDGHGFGDAVALFVTRAEAAGTAVTRRGDLVRIAELCRALNGNALAIELAAARLPTLGLDGLEIGLADPLRLLAGGSRRNSRHGSLRAVLDLSFGLTDPLDQAVVRRLAVFTGPFTLEVATAVAGFSPVPAGDEVSIVADAIGRLADQSLVTPIDETSPISYRLLPVVRQYGMERLQDADEGDQVRQRHLELGQRTATRLMSMTADERWCERFDQGAGDLRAALEWAKNQPNLRGAAWRLASSLASLSLLRGFHEEAQQHAQTAVALSGSSGTEAIAALNQAAAIATCRGAGDHAHALHLQAVQAAVEAGDDTAAARSLALAATFGNRFAGLMAETPSTADVEELLARARSLRGTDPMVDVAITVTEVFAQFESHETSDYLAQLAVVRHAVACGQELGDPLLTSAALDALIAVLVVAGNPQEAAAKARTRTDLLAALPLSAEVAVEVRDALHMAVATHLEIGDLASTRRFTDVMLKHPLYRESHLDAIRLVVGDALAGHWDVVLATAARFESVWNRQGRPVLPSLRPGAHAVAMVHALRDDADSLANWRAVHTRLSPSGNATATRLDLRAIVFEVIVLLHHLRLDEAMATLTVDPGDPMGPIDSCWRPWYAALWAETAVLADHPDAAHRVERARELSIENLVAGTIVARARSCIRGDQQSLAALADELDAAGCPYQAARTMVLAGGVVRAEGERLLSNLGAAPMPVPH